MDDDDADYMQDDEDYDFDYSDGGDDQEEGGSADVENQYYTAKGLKDDDPEKALKAFKAIVDGEKEKGDWGFKALKQSTKLQYLRLHRPQDALATYTQLLTYTKSAVTRNYSEKSINGILDYVGGASKTGALKTTSVNLDILEKFYEVTRAALGESKNDRMLIKTNLKLARLWLDRQEYGRLGKILKDLHAATQQDNDSGEDQARGTQLLEIYALEIQMYNETRNFKKLKEIYNAAMDVKNAISHPRIMGVIKECGGKMWMGEKQWARASLDFFESFVKYDEAGSPQRIQVLKYLVLANMLMGSEVNPFDSQETKPYKSDPQITAMTDLVDAYQRREVHEAEKILKNNRATIMDDPFIRSYIGDLLRSLRTQYLIDLIKPYNRLEISFLALQLNVDKDEVEELLVGLILEGRVEGRIDQTTMRLELADRHLEKRRYVALEQWVDALEGVHGAVVGKISSGRGGGESMGMGFGMGGSFMEERVWAGA
ncbi:PCI-domain-containing protein [Exidia glandulosa HHB12029]|uniref:COP9 signalosome complex subunit 2 n=1 Tax=Exidia glandulosa HHB12029 TaxID=1314781 RepID=A0A165CUH4_EXIGL|nr:PCI-domain-containing protein [Exidia glandulosa HHB12029]